LFINRYVLRSTFVGALGGLLFGFDTAVISGTTTGITHTFGLSANQLGITVSMVLCGTVVGALSAGSIGQRYGSREMLRLTAVLYLLSALGCAFAPNWPLLLAARFLGGLGIGGSWVLGPVYIAELAPPKLRGRLVGTFQINIVIGILLAYLSNYRLPGGRGAFGRVPLCFLCCDDVAAICRSVFFFPETKRVSLEELQHMLKIE
jgi:SP family arabinose:H+ symporter-like MFS transporter